MLLRLSPHISTAFPTKCVPVTTGLGVRRAQSILSPSATAREFKVVLDNNTVYVDQALAEALGWDPSQKRAVSLTLSGWAPNYFAIAPTGSDSDLLARGTVESSRNPKVQEMLAYLKER